MCLSVTFTGKTRADALKKLPESGYYYKAVVIMNGCYESHYFYRQFNAGLNIRKSIVGIGYRAGRATWIYLFRSKVDAATWARCHINYEDRVAIIRCVVKRKDIGNIGYGFLPTEQYKEDVAITARKVWMPKFKESKNVSNKTIS